MEEIECVSCDAVFTVDHDLDPEYYMVTHCPFCGSAVVDEEEVIWDDGDWDE